jgi:(p)ppGpp synthase/HD superfamily hydrolase
MTDLLPPRLADAVALAVELHGRDARKHSSVPVLAHLFNVCAIVQQDGGSEDEAIAALLHDALEDKPELVDAEAIGARFGEHVRRMVVVATDTPPDWRGGPKPPWRVRKEGYVARVANEPAELLRPTIADKIDNVRAILADHRRIGDAVFDKFKAGKADTLWYYAACHGAYVQAGGSPALLAELRKLLDELRKL